MEATNLAIMSFDGVHLLLPQKAVATIELAERIEPEVTQPGAVGTLTVGGREWPGFALDADFTIQSDAPASYKFCVGIDSDDRQAYSILCEQVSTMVVDNQTDLKAVQACMRTQGCPIEALILKDNQLMYVSDIAVMHQFLIPERVQA